jgi:hypothetical protein
MNETGFQTTPSATEYLEERQGLILLAVEGAGRVTSTSFAHIVVAERF